MKRRRAAGRALAALLYVGALSACSVLSPGSSERDALEDARSRWDSVGPKSYRVRVTVSCFCPEESRGPVDVRVTPAGVTRTYVSTGQAVGTQFVGQFPTVPQLFDTIEEALDQKADKVEVRYDPGTGAPLEVYIDRLKTAIDEEIRWTLTVPEPL